MTYPELTDQLRQFADEEPDILALLIVGSYARGTNTPDSDIDAVIITRNKQGMVENQQFTGYFGRVSRQQTEYYGACTSVRAWYEDGMEVEFGLVEPSWIAQPLDEGTRQVLRDGYKVIADRGGLFCGLEL